jgi:hypothetical protein
MPASLISVAFITHFASHLYAVGFVDFAVSSFETHFLVSKSFPFRSFAQCSQTSSGEGVQPRMINAKMNRRIRRRYHSTTAANTASAQSLPPFGVGWMPSFARSTLTAPES